ncbi:hypothetical protein Tco_0491314 [Tanacetum coccineum]
MHTTNYDQLYAYLNQHEAHATEVRLMRERFPDPLALLANNTHILSYQTNNQSHNFSLPTISASNIPQQPSVLRNLSQSRAISQQSQAEFSQLDPGRAVLLFLPGNDPIASFNKAMAFLTTAITFVFLQPTTSSEHLPIQETKLPFKMVGLQSNKCRGDRVRVLLVLDEEQLAFLADPGVVESQDTQTTIIHNAAFQTNDLNTFDSDCDEPPCAKAVLMANLSSYDSNVISETKSAAIQNTASTEQQNIVIILVFEETTNRVAKCNAESIQNKNVNESLTAELERYKERVRMFAERRKVDLNDHEKYIESQMNDMILNDSFEINL